MKLVLRKVSKSKKNYKDTIIWERWIDDEYLGFGSLDYYWRCLEQGALDFWPRNKDWYLP